MKNISDWAGIFLSNITHTRISYLCHIVTDKDQCINDVFSIFDKPTLILYEK